jgi:hypothetical protein
MSLAVVPVDTVLTMDTSYRRRPKGNEVAIYAIRRRFNRPQPQGAARFYVHWEDDALTALAHLGYTARQLFWSDFQGGQRALHVAKDGQDFLLVYELPEPNETPPSRVRPRASLLDHLSS